MVGDEDRLNQVLLTVFLEEEAQDIPLAVALLVFDVVLLRERARLLERLHLREVDAKTTVSAPSFCP